MERFIVFFFFVCVGQLSTQRTWDLSLISKDSVEAMYLQKQEAIARRERMKQYSFSHRVYAKFQCFCN